MIICGGCSKHIKTKGRYLRTCKKCGVPVCKCCNVEGFCSSCHPANADNVLVSDYFKDKYSTPIKIGLMCLLLLILTLPNSTALQFNNETLDVTLTSFKWCFTPEWDDTALMKDKLELYTDNFGCEITKKTLYAVTPVQYQEEVCTPQEPDCVNSSFYDPINDSWVDQLTCTPRPDSCKTKNATVYEKYDLEKTDYLFPKGSRICYEAKRKSRLGMQSCDMNFRIEADGKLIDVKDYGKAWWNLSFDNKFPLDCTNMTYLTPLVVNSSTGFSIDGKNQIVWTYCSGTGTALYYNNYSDYVVSNDTTQLPMEVEKGNGTSYNPSSVWNDLGGYQMVQHNNEDPTGTISDSAASSDCANINMESSDLVSAMIGDGFSFDGVDEVVDCADDDFTNNGSVEAWFTSDSNPVAGNCEAVIAKRDSWFLYTGDASKEGVLLIKFVSASWTYTPEIVMDVNKWYYFAGTYNNSVMASWINGTQNSTTSVVGDTFTQNAFGISMGANAAGINCPFGGDIDEVRISNVYRDANYFDQVYNNVAGTTGYGNLGASETAEVSTDLLAGLFDSDFNNISLTVSELQLFFVFANYSFSENSTAINDSIGFCNYSSDNLIDPFTDTGTGVNTTICASGCDFSNKTANFTGLTTQAFVNDFYEMELCHVSNPARDVTISTNCSESFTIPFQNIPLCAAGVLNVSINSQNCSGQSSVLMSVTSGATASGHATVLVDDTLIIHRRHNHTEDLIFNVSLQLWHSDDIHLFEEHGSESINVSCFENATGLLQNQTSLLNITVVNIPPVIIIDEIWWWLLTDGIFFSDGITAKYPLQETLNITSQCVDDDVFQVITYLNYSGNGTNIDTHVNGGSVGFQINYTRSNFSTDLTFLDGDVGYVFQTWCNDTTGNISSDQKNFTVVNLIPVTTWLNSSPLTVPSVPRVINWSCVDDEEETGNSFLFIDAPNLSVSPNQTGGSGYVFNLEEGTYNFTVLCSDSFRNSTQDDLSLIFQAQCTLNVSSPCDGCRYADNELMFSSECSNSVNITSCSFAINDFVAQSLTSAQCSNFNFTAERGWNTMLVMANTDVGSVNVTINFWAKDQDASIFMFPVLWSMLLVMGFSFLMGSVYNVFYVIGGIAGLVVGFQLIAFSVTLGIIFAVLSPLVSIGLFFKGTQK